MSFNLFKRFSSPWLLPIISFTFLILVGACFLMLFPLPATHGHYEESHLNFIDALFMATSASCVTGLSIMNIGTDLTKEGQLVILILIQLGGLGIMTFSTGLLLFLGRNISLKSRFILQDTFTYSPRSDFLSLLKRIIIFTVILEAFGALLLFIRFLPHEQSWQRALYSAIFHSISAFCNAGFSLFANSMTDYRHDYIVNFTMCALIIAGGLGFLVLHELYSTVRIEKKPYRIWNRLSLHSRVVLFTTTVMITSGIFLFIVSEWKVTMHGFNFTDRLLASLFQSVTTRTAGFNTLNFASMNNVTLFGTMILMFIGASPGSTGGGIKTTTLTALIAMGLSRMKGLEHPSVFKRTIDPESINKALAVFVVGTIVIVSGAALLLITELGYKPYTQTRGFFIQYLFETISAFGTVGLSMGITPTLSKAGKIVVICLMIIGRLGPLTVAMAIRPRPLKAQYRYAEEKIMIG